MTEQTQLPGAGGVALVTAAGRRIGRSIALDLGRAGYRVAIHYLTSSEDAESAAEEIRNGGGQAEIFQADLADADETLSLVPAVAAKLGPLTCLVNNASLFEPDDIASVTPETWDAHLNINLRAPVLLARAFADQVPADIQGNIINLLDERVWRPNPQYLSYYASKAGLWALTQTMAQGLGAKVRVNGIGPGPTLPNSRQTEEEFRAVQARLPLGYGAGTDEICRAVRFILESPAMTGQMIALDGGQHLAWQTPDVMGESG